MKTRRGLSTVVGAVFAIIAITTTMVYVSYSIGMLNNYNQSAFTKNQQLSDTNKEKFQVTSVTTSSNKFNITVANTGNLPISFTKIWVQNTSATDWVNSYTPTNNFVAPGSVLTKIGQDIPVYINPAKSYNVKLVTSRGNTQQFNVNSAGSAPLGIQLLAVPATVSSGFKTELLMIVTNNGSSTLTNLSPQTPTESAGFTASCSLDQNQASPPSYNTLLPGGTAIFKWDLKVSGTSNGQFCTWTAQLQNGYNGNTASATVTVTQITLSSTNYAQTAGILSLNYTTWKWSQGNGWKSSWAVPSAQASVFSMQLTNYNATGTLYLSKLTQIILIKPFVGGQADSYNSYIVTAVNVSPTPPTVTAFGCNGPPTNEYCVSVAPLQTITLYFAATAPLGSTVQVTPSVAQYTGYLVIFGKFDTSQNGNGPLYAQNIPYIALNIT